MDSPRTRTYWPVRDNEELFRPNGGAEPVRTKSVRDCPLAGNAETSRLGVEAQDELGYQLMSLGHTSTVALLCDTRPNVNRADTDDKESESHRQLDSTDARV